MTVTFSGEEDGEGVEQEEDGDQDEGEDADMAEGEDGAENAEDEENQEESQGEEYCVVDEVEGDQDSSKVEDTKVRRHTGQGVLHGGRGGGRSGLLQSGGYQGE